MIRLHIFAIMEESIDIWLSVISIIIAVIAIIISTYFAARAIHQSWKENWNCKKETIFDIINDFLLYLETISNAEKYGIENFYAKKQDIDFKCLETIGKIHCFSQKNNLREKNKNFLESYINNILDYSNMIQDIRKIIDYSKRKIELENLSNKIRILRGDILSTINHSSFFKEEKSCSEGKYYV